LGALAAPVALAATHADPPLLTGIPVDFILFALTLAGSRCSTTIRCGSPDRIAVITAYKLAFTGFKKARIRRPRHPPAARMGGPREPLHAADRLRAAVAALREKPRAAGAAARTAGRLVRAFVLLLMVFVLSSFSTTSPPR